MTMAKDRFEEGFAEGEKDERRRCMGLVFRSKVHVEEDKQYQYSPYEVILMFERLHKQIRTGS